MHRRRVARQSTSNQRPVRARYQLPRAVESILIDSRKLSKHTKIINLSKCVVDPREESPLDARTLLHLNGISVRTYF